MISGVCRYNRRESYSSQGSIREQVLAGTSAHRTAATAATAAGIHDQSTRSPSRDSPLKSRTLSNTSDNSPVARSSAGKFTTMSTISTSANSYNASNSKELTKYMPTNSSTKEIGSPDLIRDSPHRDRLSNSDDERKDIEYENAPSIARHYNRQNSDSTRRHAVALSAEETLNNDLSSSNEKMVFAQPIAHVSSEANKLIVNKVEKVQIDKPRTQSDSAISHMHANHTDVVNVSKQATVKEIPITSSAAVGSASSYIHTNHVSDNDSDSDFLPQFVTPIYTPPQRAIVRQRSKESPVSAPDRPKSPLSVNDPVKMSDPSASVKPVQSSTTTSNDSITTDDYVTSHVISKQRETVSREELSSDSMSSDDKHSSPSSSLASLSNVVAPCGSTEDLDIVDNEVFPLIPESPDHEQVENSKYEQDRSLPVSSILGTTDSGGTSDLMRDITKSLNEALSSMDEVMSRGMKPTPTAAAPNNTNGESKEDKIPDDNQETTIDTSRIAENGNISNAVSAANDDVGTSSLLSFNDGRIVFNLGDNGSMLSKVRYDLGCHCLSGVVSKCFTC